MHDCSKDIIGFHDESVTLQNKDRSEMRKRRDANRDRLKKGLEKNEDPSPKEFVTQGSYAMKTMVQQLGKDYDIDEGVYFKKEDLVGSNGADMSSLNARKMVRDAVDDGSFSEVPEVRENCVRVMYDAGFHVDIPVYRHSVENDEDKYELASSEWKRSDARDVTSWFDQHNQSKSPDTENGRQLRRIVRLLKKFAKSRESWKGSLLGGFGITKLVVDNYQSNSNREDRALYDTMSEIHSYLISSLVVNHPVTPGDTITKGNDDPKARKLREKLKAALDNLEPLFEEDCSRKTALECWDKVFNTDYFSKKLSNSNTNEAYKNVAPGIISKELLGNDRNNILPPVDKKGDSTFA